MMLGTDVFWPNNHRGDGLRGKDLSIVRTAL